MKKTETLHRMIATALYKHTGYHKSPFVCMPACLAQFDGEKIVITEFCGFNHNVVHIKRSAWFCPECHRIIMYPGWSDE